MATQRSTFAKLQRERAKKAKAAAKRERRHDRSEGDVDDVETPDGPVVTYSDEDTLKRLQDLHERFEAGAISYDAFEETKAELFSRLSID